MKTSKCIYCDHRFRKREWHTEIEGKKCIGCQRAEGMLKSFQMVLMFNDSNLNNIKSKTYWNDQISKLLI